MSKDFVDIALGESFYFIRNGKIQNRVFPNGISITIENNIASKQKMFFDNNTSDWDVWNSKEYETFVTKKCNELGIIFSMHSEEALEKFCSKKSESR